MCFATTGGTFAAFDALFLALFNVLLPIGVGEVGTELVHYVSCLAVEVAFVFGVHGGGGGGVYYCDVFILLERPIDSCINVLVPMQIIVQEVR